MTGCIDRKTGKVTIIGNTSSEELEAIVRRLLSAANVIKEGSTHA